MSETLQQEIEREEEEVKEMWAEVDETSEKDTPTEAIIEPEAPEKETPPETDEATPETEADTPETEPVADNIVEINPAKPADTVNLDPVLQKRYADLQAHVTRSTMENAEVKRRNEALTAQLEQMQKDIAAAPTPVDANEAKLKEEYGDLAEVLLPLINNRNQQSPEVKGQVEALQAELADIRSRDFTNTVLEAHNDLEDVRTSRSFAAWLNADTGTTTSQKRLLLESHDPNEAIRLISQFKTDHAALRRQREAAIPPPTPKPANQTAGANIEPKSEPRNMLSVTKRDAANEFTPEAIAKMSDREYASKRDDIFKALSAGAI